MEKETSGKMSIQIICLDHHNLLCDKSSPLPFFVAEEHHRSIASLRQLCCVSSYACNYTVLLIRKEVGELITDKRFPSCDFYTTDLAIS